MSDIPGSNPNFPSTVPLDKPNQYQKSFFPFEAFSADDPNATSPPKLILKYPWRLVYDNTVVPLSAAISGNTTYNTIPNVQGLYTVWIPVAYLKASAGGPFTLTLSTGVAGKSSVTVPIAASGDTITSTDLLFDVYVDGAGNLSSKAWEISGSNANGSWIKFDDGTMECWYTSPTLRTTSTPYGNIWYASPIDVWSFPVTFVGLPVTTPIIVTAAGITWGCVVAQQSFQAEIYIVGALSGSQGYAGYRTVGSWK